MSDKVVALLFTGKATWNYKQELKKLAAEYCKSDFKLCGVSLYARPPHWACAYYCQKCVMTLINSIKR